jgi:hypothetical protein
VKNRLGLAVLLLVAADLAVGLWLSADAPALAGYWRVSRIALKAIGGLGSLWAALGLRRDDYMAKVWGLFALSYFGLVAGDVAVTIDVGLTAPALGTSSVRGLALVAANAAGLAGSVLLARAYRAAGIGLPRSLAWSAGLLAAIAFSAAMIAKPLWQDLSRYANEANVESAGLAFGELCDAFTLVLLVPVIRFALALRGGRLARAWLTLAAAGAAWILYDLVWAFPGATGLLDTHTRLLAELFRAAGCLCWALAGWHHRKALEAGPELSSPRP